MHVYTKITTGSQHTFLASGPIEYSNWFNKTNRKEIETERAESLTRVVAMLQGSARIALLFQATQ